jgi:hypothetical protein
VSGVGASTGTLIAGLPGSAATSVTLTIARPSVKRKPANPKTRPKSK